MRGQSKYSHQRADRFFTLFFIPLIPLGKLGEYVECESCKGTFKPEVLSYDPETAAKQWRALYVQGMLGVMVRMMAVDGRVGRTKSMLSAEFTVSSPTWTSLRLM